MQISKELPSTGALRLPPKLEARYMDPAEQKRLQASISVGAFLQQRLQMEQKTHPVVAEQLQVELRKALIRPEPAACASLPRAAQIVLGLDDHVMFDFCSSRFPDSVVLPEGRPL